MSLHPEEIKLLDRALLRIVGVIVCMVILAYLAGLLDRNALRAMIQ